MRRTWRWGLCILAAWAMAWVALPASAEVRIELDKTGGGHNIVVSGPIDLFTLYAFARAIGDSRITAARTPLVELNSPGGSVAVAMAVGHLIHDRGFDTGVDRHHECHSACVLILAAGARRGVASSRVGIHRPHNGKALLTTASPELDGNYMQVGESMRSYLKRMGMADGFLPAMLNVPSDRIKLLSRHEMVAFGLVQDEPFGPSRVDPGDTECSAQREVVADKQSVRKDRQQRTRLHAHAPAKKARRLVSAPTRPRRAKAYIGARRQVTSQARQLAVRRASFVR